MLSDVVKQKLGGPVALRGFAARCPAMTRF
jgi:hypothetical protein